MPSLLALDASLYVGYAYFSSPNAQPKCRTWVAPAGLWKSEDYGPYFLAFGDWLLEMLDVLQPEHLAFESPVVANFGPGRGTDENNLRRLIGIVSIAELIAASNGLPCHEVHNQTAKAFMGVSRRKDKNDMIVAVTAKGFKVADQHQADACAVGLVAYDSLGFDI